MVFIWFDNIFPFQKYSCFPHLRLITSNKKKQKTKSKIYILFAQFDLSVSINSQNKKRNRRKKNWLLLTVVFIFEAKIFWKMIRTNQSSARIQIMKGFVCNKNRNITNQKAQKKRTTNNRKKYKLIDDMMALLCIWLIFFLFFVFLLLFSFVARSDLLVSNQMKRHWETEATTKK